MARQINELNEASLFLKVDPFKSDRSTNELPMVLFELEPNGGLVQKTFNLEAKDAERVNLPLFKTCAFNLRYSQIGVEDLAGDGSAGQEFGAAMRLYHRVQILRQYLQDVEAGELPGDGEIIRPAQSLLSQLPKPPTNDLESSSTGSFHLSKPNSKPKTKNPNPNQKNLNRTVQNVCIQITVQSVLWPQSVRVRKVCSSFFLASRCSTTSLDTNIEFAASSFNLRENCSCGEKKRIFV